MKCQLIMPCWERLQVIPFLMLLGQYGKKELRMKVDETSLKRIFNIIKFMSGASHNLKFYIVIIGHLSDCFALVLKSHPLVSTVIKRKEHSLMLYGFAKEFKNFGVNIHRTLSIIANIPYSSRLCNRSPSGFGGWFFTNWTRLIHKELDWNKWHDG